MSANRPHLQVGSVGLIGANRKEIIVLRRVTFILFLVIAFVLAQNALAQVSLDLRGGTTYPGGSLIPGYDGMTCDSNIEGAIRYASSASCVEFCDGTAWVCPGSAGTSTTICSDTTGLLGYWKFDESAGTLASDSSGNGNDGTLQNGPVWQPTDGVTGGSLLLDGNNDYVDLTAGLGSRTYTEFSVSGWFRSTNTTLSDDMYLFVSGDSFNGMILSVSDDYLDGMPRMVFADSVHTYPTLGGPNVLDQTWHHMVMVRKEGTLELYVDGEISGTQHNLPLDPTLDPIPNVAYIGDDPGNTEQAAGSVDNFRLYNRALSPAAVAGLYNDGAACP